MAIQEQMNKKSLVINVEDGVNTNGSIKTKARTYSGIKAGATAEDCFAVGTALGNLMANTVQGIALSEKVDLVEQA